MQEWRIAKERVGRGLLGAKEMMGKLSVLQWFINGTRTLSEWLLGRWGCI